jgi:hypothetical protein
MSSRNVKDLVPGDPEEVWRLANSYNQMAHTCEDVGHGLRGIDDGGWSGPAAAAFRARFERQPNRFLAMADNYGRAAVALDTYAAALAWAQRQAGEVIALGGKEDPPGSARPAAPVLTAAQQVELTGVIAGTDAPELIHARDDEHALVHSNYHRALAMLETIGDTSATTIMKAAELIPAPLPQPPTDTVASPPSPSPTAAGSLVLRTVLPPSTSPTWSDPATPRDDPQGVAAAIREIRKRLRWDGLNRLSPRLARHLFEGHYKSSTGMCAGYHHREGGVDRGLLRVSEIIEGPDRHGVYKAFVRGPKSVKKTAKSSTFFPDSWSRAEVMHAVRHAFQDAMDNGKYDSAERRFRGVYKGVEIEGYVVGVAGPRFYDILTAYPRRVQKRRKRS